MTEHTLTEAAKAMYTSRLANDVAATRAHFTQDAVLGLAGAAEDPSLSFAPDQGDGVTAILEVLIGTWQWHTMTVHDQVISGDKAAFRYTLDTTHIPTGERIQTEISDHIAWNGEKITSFIEFVDTGMVERLTNQSS
ncbi:MAG: nuclear transport factor 2 family protein [Pseudomonadota bacterium]